MQHLLRQIRALAPPDSGMSKPMLTASETAPSSTAISSMSSANSGATALSAGPIDRSARSGSTG